MSTEIPDGICYNNITEINHFCEVIIMLNNVKNGSVKILPGVFRERMDVNRRYLMERLTLTACSRISTWRLE